MSTHRSSTQRLAAQASLIVSRAGFALGRRSRRRYQLLRALTRGRREATLHAAA